MRCYGAIVLTSESAFKSGYSGNLDSHGVEHGTGQVD